VEIAEHSHLNRARSPSHAAMLLKPRNRPPWLLLLLHAALLVAILLWYLAELLNWSSNSV